MAEFSYQEGAIAYPTGEQHGPYRFLSHALAASVLLTLMMSVEQAI